MPLRIAAPVWWSADSLDPERARALRQPWVTGGETAGCFLNGMKPEFVVEIVGCGGLMGFSWRFHGIDHGISTRSYFQKEHVDKQ